MIRFVTTTETAILSARERGFTLIEMLVALSLFSVVSVIVAGSLVSLIGNNLLLQSKQQMSVGLAAALDNMTREIRMGVYYYCHDGNFGGGAPLNISSAISPPDISASDCDGGESGMAFRETVRRLTSASSNDRIAFYHRAPAGAVPGAIMRRIGNTVEPITPETINITGLRFFVTGTDTLTAGNDTIQPTVTIIVEAEDRQLGASAERFIIQSTVTQRVLDL